MDFLYRMHLVDFDPKDGRQIQANWDWIREAIRLSSASLYSEIEKIDYGSAPPPVKNKIRKYLLRGRYRSTPFGMWAGVGVGTWGVNTLAELPLCYSPIVEDGPISADVPFQEDKSYQAAPGLKVHGQEIHYWTYCPESEGWRISFLDKNPLLEILLAYFEKCHKLDFETFKTFFKTKNKEYLHRIWKMLLESGVVVSEDFVEVSSSRGDLGIDVMLVSKLSVNRAVQEKLEHLVTEIGNLFVPVESDYLGKFKAWFSHSFDDRFVPISLLAHQHEFFKPLFPIKPDSGSNAELMQQLWKQSRTFDLSTCFQDKQTDLDHLQIAFKVLGENEVFVENIVCNRPFAYSGRFSLAPSVKQFLIEKHGKSPSDAVLADIVFFESSKSNYIARHENIFRYTIYPFGPSGKNQCRLGTEDLLLGLRENRMVLYSQRLGTQVIPIVQHPINPEQISHPLSRMQWEIANQDQYRFLPYQDPAFQNSRYVPRLTWKGVILQGTRWILNSRDHKSKNELFEFLQNSGIACPVQAGHLDRELVVDWTDPIELGFLWEELRRLTEITLYECPWIQSSPFQADNGQQLYPQMVYFWRGKKKAETPLGFLNRIVDSDAGWIYARIGIKETYLIPFLAKALPQLIREIKSKFQLHRWYCLFYDSDVKEIRLRIHLADPDSLRHIRCELEDSLRKSGWVDSVQFGDYYPEFEKYSLANQGISCSESLFHLESEAIFLGDDCRNIPPILSWEPGRRLAWITNRYHCLIEMTGIQLEFFRYLRGLLKQIPSKERPRYRVTDLRPSRLDETLGIESFQAIGRSLASATPEELLRIIPNQLHMCCNRAFPLDTYLQERRVMYGIYGLLGKSLYCRSSTL
ncbi:lantibiotic dehydratase [Algoriphagus sp. H41]|uniref:Lantibiotic dehydratase n=1 Tax=Algoriphagus oliviformis TaxID=2811231 RepID=A0ABS3C7L4_9BACT|nr:lantibiotic dehydratase [Algoriphagus oliviformis]MBN7813096.1 lantibiotic dehydratase [Algoriphagus oliviformis]